MGVNRHLMKCAFAVRSALRATSSTLKSAFPVVCGIPEHFVLLFLVLLHGRSLRRRLRDTETGSDNDGIPTERGGNTHPVGQRLKTNVHRMRECRW